MHSGDCGIHGFARRTVTPTSGISFPRECPSQQRCIYIAPCCGYIHNIDRLSSIVVIVSHRDYVVACPDCVLRWPANATHSETFFCLADISIRSLKIARQETF